MTTEKIFCRIFAFNFVATGERIKEAEIAETVNTAISRTGI
jgi:hypothetical protein